MNANTGEIRMLSGDSEAIEEEILMGMNEFTKDQLERMSVEIDDDKTEAGKKLQNARKERGLPYVARYNFHDLSRNQRRNIRKKLKRK